MMAPTGAVLRRPGAIPHSRRAPVHSTQRRAPPHPALRRAAARNAAKVRIPTINLPSLALPSGRELCQKAVPWLKIAAGALAAATIGLAIANNMNREEPIAVYEVASANNQTVVYARMPVAPVHNDQLSVDRADEGEGSPFYRAVQTVKFLNPNRRETAATEGEATGPKLASAYEPKLMTRIRGFVAFSGSKDTETTTPSSVRPDFPRKRGAPEMEEVDNYLWEVYQREPVKKDGAGDFTWKDPAAAKRLGMNLQDYVIGGMDPDFREQLYHAGKAMDAAGIQWSILSGFRDDYRQQIAAGFKARTGNSLHGGSRATGGYGHGRAVDIIGVEDSSSEVWRWIDAHGAKYGLVRPIPGPDPAHTQSRGDWHKIASNLRETRTKIADAGRGKDTKAKVAKAGM